MKIAVLTLLGVYLLGAVFFIWMNLAMGPVTPALAIIRGALWPLWLMGYLQGERSE